MRIDTQADRIHVVSPNNKADATNGDHRIGHAQITKHRFFGKCRNDVADNTKARQDENVHFRMPKEPKQVLEHNRVTATRRVKKCCTEIAVGQQHGDGTRQNRQRQQQQEHGHKNRPDKKWHFVQSHARRAHVENGGDEVNRTQNG